jgi:hypothetical protein
MTTRQTRPLRGLAGLRTLGGLADKRTPTYKAYLRVSFLELERARHGQEIGAARRHLDFMLGRCREIDTEKEAILAVLGPSAPARPADPPARSAKRPFHVRY